MLSSIPNILLPTTKRTRDDSPPREKWGWIESTSGGEKTSREHPLEMEKRDSSAMGGGRELLGGKEAQGRGRTQTEWTHPEE